MARTVNHIQNKHRFELIEDGVTSTIDYTLDGNVMSITHTKVPSEVGGRGIAGDLTRNALETAKSNNWQVKPVCSYAAAYIKRHSEYQNLLAE